MRTVGSIIILILASAGEAAAQPPPDFSTLKVKAGDTVFVTDTSTGVEVSGRLSALSPSELSIDGYRFEPRPALKIERSGDSVWDGFLVGFGLGAFFIYPLVPEPFGPAGRQIVRVDNGLLWGAVGALIDSQIHGRTTIYVSPQKKGVALGMRFGRD